MINVVCAFEKIKQSDLKGKQKQNSSAPLVDTIEEKEKGKYKFDLTDKRKCS